LPIKISLNQERTSISAYTPTPTAHLPMHTTSALEGMSRQRSHSWQPQQARQAPLEKEQENKNNRAGTNQPARKP